jgi:hypothetical protein
MELRSNQRLKFFAAPKQSQVPSMTASAFPRTFSSTPLILRAGSSVKGGSTVFVSTGVVT